MRAGSRPSQIREGVVHEVGATVPVRYLLSVLFCLVCLALLVRFSCRLSPMLKQKRCAINESRCGVESSDSSAFLNVSNFPYIFLIIDAKKYSSVLQQVLLRALFQSPGTPLVPSFLFFCITYTHMEDTVTLNRLNCHHHHD